MTAAARRRARARRRKGALAVLLVVALSGAASATATGAEDTPTSAADTTTGTTAALDASTAPGTTTSPGTTIAPDPATSPTTTTDLTAGTTVAPGTTTGPTTDAAAVPGTTTPGTTTPSTTTPGPTVETTADPVDPWTERADLVDPEQAAGTPVAWDGSDTTRCVYRVSLEGSDTTGDGSAARPWRTIPNAVAKVPDQGCVILVAPGRYEGYVNLKRRLSKTLTIRSLVPHAAVLVNDGTVLDIDGGRNLVIEGFRLTQSGPGPAGQLSYVAIIDRSGSTWSERITLRNNILHDSLNDDLLKVHNGVEGMNVVGNVFYNQGPSEQHIDVNSVRDVRITGNLFFNDLARSGRQLEAQKSYIVVKDSNGETDGMLGSRDITIDRNVFANWQGGPDETFVQIGNDGKPYHEAIGVRLERNLFLAHSPFRAQATVGVRGVKDVTLNANTVVGDLPSSAFGLWVNIRSDNPQNDGLRVLNNVFADPTATMGRFSTGAVTSIANAGLDRNLYWNGGAALADGTVIGPSADARAVRGDPKLPAVTGPVLVPYWTGTAFLSGATTVRAEFRRLVETYGTPGAGSAAFVVANPATAPLTDILGRAAGPTPDLGAVQSSPTPLTPLSERFDLPAGSPPLFARPAPMVLSAP